MMMTMKMAIQTPGLTLSAGNQNCMTREAAVNWFGVMMMYLNQ